ncbi:MAG: 3-isopropylmalate dehydratase small subunit [archaeon]|jgi:3-isopropylmalate/(R)-2-methylmalate dehydratase small subunit|nr:3-isopropylmalate dehydratase small subunit [archaeon]
MNIKGKSWKFKDNVDTDVIIPARYLNSSNPKELASHCMEDIDKDFTKKISAGDIIVAGKNFGCGSSREHAPIAIKNAGISCVVAESFARIFYRNSINMGLPIFESAEASQKISEGDELEVNAETGEIKTISKNETYKAVPMPPFIQKIIKLGGLMEYVKQETKK